MKLNNILLATTLGFSSLFALDIYPEVSGQITYLKQVGDSIKKGDALVQIDNKQISATLSKEKAKLDYLQIILEDKKLIETQNQELYESTVLPKRDLDLIVLERQIAEAKYNEQKAIVEYYELEKKKYTIVSPINGSILDIPNRRNVTNINQPQILMKLENK